MTSFEILTRDMIMFPIPHKRGLNLGILTTEQHCLPSIIVSLRNRMAERRGWKNGVCHKHDGGYYLQERRVLSGIHLTCFLLFYKKICLKVCEVWWKRLFKQNYCHACHTRFAIVFPLPSCCVSSLIAKININYTCRQ